MIFFLPVQYFVLRECHITSLYNFLPFGFYKFAIGSTCDIILHTSTQYYLVIQILLRQYYILHSIHDAICIPKIEESRFKERYISSFIALCKDILAVYIRQQLTI